MKARILVIVPAFNESGSIAGVVQEIVAARKDASVLVVDDGSVDDTALRAARAGAQVVRLPFNLGIGGAVQTGYRWAERNGYNIAVQIDGDGQHDPRFLDAMLAPLLCADADMVVGSRFAGEKGGFQSSFSRRVGILFFVSLIRLLTGLRCTDPTSGFRACGPRLIRLFAAHYPNDFPEPEAIVIARRLGAVVREVPVLMRARSAGRSSIGKLKSPYYMLKVTAAIMLDMFKHRKVFGPWE